MQLTLLSVQHVRRIATAQIRPAGGINLISGLNGSGKTSLLESIHYLATARSFRTGRVADVISYGQQGLVVSGELTDKAGFNNRVGVEKSPTATRLRVNGEAVEVASKIARLVPVLILNSDSYRLLEGGPSNRRALLDRLLFHVKQEYLSVLKTYYRGLKHRNSLLRSGAAQQQVWSWDQQIAPLADKIDRWRLGCVAMVNTYLNTMALTEIIGPLHLEYQRGWRAEKEFGALLAGNWFKDRDAGTTTVGPHRADLRIKVGGKLARTVVSRGQGKLIIAAIVSAQASVIREHGSETPILLVDDLASDLDRSARGLAVNFLLSTGAQLFFTAIEPSDLPGSLCETATRFHVEQGTVRAAAIN